MRWNVAVVVLLLAVGAAARRQPRPLTGRWLLQGGGNAGNGTAATTTRPAGGQGYQKHGADFCNCPDDDKAVCGTDQQTYLNECVMRCAGAIKLKDGVCSKACYPPGARREGGDWSSRDPVCASGITYMNRAEAMYDGYPDECITEGVCQYVDVGQGPVSYEPTTGGKGKKWEDAAANTQLPDKSKPDYDYSEALQKSLLYYDSQISGTISPGYKRLAWRDNSCFTCKGKYGEDLSGGYFESGGSSLKLGSVSSYAPAFLGAAALCFPGGFNKTGLLDDIKFKVKWGADYLINAHVEEYVFMGSMGNQTEDFDNYAPWELYEKYEKNPRLVGYCTKDDPCSEVTGLAAAALASASELLRTDNAAWADKALEHAKQLYAFATEYPGSYMDSSDDGVKVLSYLYSSTGYQDELAYAAAMLFKVTGEEKYKTDAAKYFKAVPGTPLTQEVGELKPLTAVLMAQLDPDTAEYRTAAEAFFNQYLNGTIRHTDCGLAIPYHWGGMTHGPNVATLGMCYAKAPKVDAAYAARLFNYGKHQVDYVLGDCGRSWMVGFGEKYPQYLHQEAAYNSILVWKDDKDPLGERIPGTMHLGPITQEKTDRPQQWQKAMPDFLGNWFPARHIAYGTMFGAPLMNDGLVLSRRDYTYAEPTITYNSAIVGALAGLAEYYDVEPWTGELKEVNSVDYRPYLLKN